MRKQPDGDLEVSLGETVTVVIEATDTAFLASTGPIQLGQWSSIDRDSPRREIRRFTVSRAFSSNFSFTIGFDFSAGQGGTIPATARYTVTLTGSGPGGATRQRIVEPTSILPTSRIFSFEVGQG
jgi:hypothetical protein